MCSTPFGITEVGTLHKDQRVPAIGGAQRLSASQRWALRAGPHRRRDQTVLNAFRHHRGGHIAETPCFCRGCGVLNAFRHHRGGHCSLDRERNDVPLVLNAFRHHRGGHVYCSPPSELLLPVVLNAFRHHRGGHTFSQWQSNGASGVLNAFRHHRGGHNEGTGATTSVAMCSTPFGITEVGTPRSQPITIPAAAPQLFKGPVAASRMARAIGRAGGVPAS